MTKEKLEELGRLLDKVRALSERVELFQDAVDDAEDGAALTIEIHTRATIAKVCATHDDEIFNSVLKTAKDLTARLKIHADELERHFETLAKKKEAEE